MKKILKVMLVIMMAVMVTACGGGDNTDSGDKKETKLLIGISPDYPPYESLNTKNEMEGFDIDMTKELVDIMNKNGGNYSYEFKQMSFESIRSSVETDQVDLGISASTPPVLKVSTNTFTSVTAFTSAFLISLAQVSPVAPT